MWGRRALRAPIGMVAQWLRPTLRNDFAICAIFREEAPFLDEWISFHASVGATHFYLYNNFSTDNFREVLAPWVARGAVTLIDWPRTTGQLSAYQDCVRRSRRVYEWVAFIDIDEFLFSPQAIDIRDILRRYQDLPGIEIWQAFFGSGGHNTRPPLPVTEAYLKRARLAARQSRPSPNPAWCTRLAFINSNIG
jgi:hypothetical protein